MLLFTSVQLCASKKPDFPHDDSTKTHSGMSPSQIILTKKKKRKKVGLTPRCQCLLRGTTKNPFDWSMGLPAQHTFVWPMKSKYP